jgi:hypothetical protein
MQELERKLHENIPEIELLKERFNVIENETLRTNLAISLQYIIFLITLGEELKLPGPVLYSIYKNIILHTASIIEGSLHYTLNTLIKRKKLDSEKVMSKEDIYSNRKILYTTDDGTQICGIHYKKKAIKLMANTNFLEINRACKRGQILNDDLFEEIERLREKRNKIHLAGLTIIDDFYDKEDIKKAFDTANKVLTIIEERLKDE